MNRKMQTDVIYFKSSESMSEIADESVDLIVTSPPYNINIQYGNITEKGKPPPEVFCRARQYSL